MSDLDFDELHNEVSKLMEQAGKPKPKKAAPVKTDKPEKSETPEPAEPPKEAPAPAEPPKEAPKEETPSEQKVQVAVRRAPVAQIVPKRIGVAMDIVQPVKAPAAEPPSSRASRTAPTLQPTGPVSPEPPSPRETTAPAPESPKAEPSAETLASLNLQADSSHSAFHDHDVKQTFPDPLEVHGFTGDEEKPTGEPAQQAATMEHKTVISPPAAPPAEQPANEPAAPPADAAGTPFVNAKVEKRPLGAFATTPDQPTNDAAQPAEGDKGPTKDDKAAIDLPPAPKELDPAVVAVESAEPEFTPGTPGAPEPEKSGVNELRQMSIPQQYKESTAEPSKDDRPIFDTKTYHPPLQPVAKVHKGGSSKAGMLLTLILIVLLVAAGVAAYFVATGAIDVNSLLKSL